MIPNKKTTITIDGENRKFIESLKVIPREPCNDVLTRLRKEKQKSNENS